MSAQVRSGPAATSGTGTGFRVVDVLHADGGTGLLLLIIGLIIAVLLGMILVGWIVRLGVLVILVGIAPAALACHATPFTDPAARLWWRSLLGCLGTVVLQAVALYLALSIFLNRGRSRRRRCWGCPTTRPGRSAC